MHSSVKRYYFVDETGQDTGGRLFIITVSVVERDHQEIEKVCFAFEKATGKNLHKWHGTPNQRRLSFMELVILDPRFKGVMCYAKFTNIHKSEFDKQTIKALAQAIKQTRDENRSSSEIYIDGLTVKKQSEYSNGLKAEGIRSFRIHRATDQGYVLIRLADALAGLTRDAIENPDSEAAKLLKRGKRNGVIVEIEAEG